MKNNIRIPTCQTIFIIYIALSVSVSCNAFDCLVEPDTEESLKKSDSVFIGKVISSKKYNSAFDTIKFKVSKNYKNTNKSKVSILTNNKDGIFGFHFEENKEYLVYTQTKISKLYTSACSKTKHMEQATTNELEVLSKNRK